jgi:hypothetical protein
MDERTNLSAGISLPSDFHFGEVSSLAPNFRTTELALSPSVSTPGLGSLAAFAGTWTGSGFNTIFRPNSNQTPTKLPVQPPGPPLDNVLELNLTTESLAFSPSLGSVPNRGMVQGDVFLNGVPYMQTISDVTIPSQKTGIHVEPGIWIIVPSTTNPAEGETLVRMASIPHGTTIMAQGTSRVINGPPTIPSVDITPFFTRTNEKVRFANQTAATPGTSRIPQDLTAFIAAGTITQAMLDDPNTFLRNHIAGQKIISTTEITVATAAKPPLFGGGTDNIAFLEGDATSTSPNALAVTMTATFWIETVEHTILVPIFKPGQPPLTIAGEAPMAHGHPVPRFLVNPPIEITKPRTIKVHSTQIQYTQEVMLNFNTLTWPHVSVATLAPAGAIPIPPSVWTT